MVPMPHNLHTYLCTGKEELGIVENRRTFEGPGKNGELNKSPSTGILTDNVIPIGDKTFAI